MWQIAVIVIYFMLALAAFIAVRNDDDLRLLGGALIFSQLVSTAVWWFDLDYERAAIYTVTEILISTLAFFGWVSRQNRTLIAVVVASTLSITANIAYSYALDPMNVGQTAKVLQYRHAVATNAMFVVECVFVFATGVINRVGAGGFSLRFDLRRNFALLHGKLAVGAKKS